MGTSYEQSTSVEIRQTDGVPLTSSNNHVNLERTRVTQPLGIKSLLIRHIPDWATFLCLAAIDIGLQFVEPVQNFAGEYQMASLNYPLENDSVPFWAVGVVAVVCPILVFIIYFVIKRDSYDLHQSILGLLYSLALNAVITDGLKLGVGRLRPDFFWRCFPSGDAVYSTSAPFDIVCSGTPSVVEEGRKSFPSGHTSWSFAGLGFLSLFLSAKLHTFSPLSGLLFLLLPPLIPLLGATAIAITRLVDYHHNPTDVIGGALIGLAMASLCYYLFYPALTRRDCEKPRITREMEGRRSNSLRE